MATRCSAPRQCGRRLLTVKLCREIDLPNVGVILGLALNVIYFVVVFVLKFQPVLPI